MDDQPHWEAEQSKESVVKRLVTFLRSVSPVDPLQLLFLTGAILLLISPRISWRPDALVHGAKLNYSEVYGHLVAGNIVVLAAGLMAFYACFWPLRNPVRWVFWGVLMIGLVGLFFIFWGFFDATAGPRSILDTSNRLREMFSWVRLNISNFPPDVFVLFLALALIAIYFSRMVLHAGSLPFVLSNVDVGNEEQRDIWARIRLVIFVLVGLVTSVAGIPYMLAMLVWKLSVAHINVNFTDYVFASTNALLSAGLLLGIVFYILGQRGRTAARLSLKMPALRFALLAFLLPAVGYALIPLSHFVFDRAYWANFEFRRLDPPMLSTYFDPGRLLQPWAMFSAFNAFAEEVIFRGVLLPEFLKRYGLYRGIFLTGIAWAAVHFRSDSYGGLSVPGILSALVTRIVLCLGMNYVLAWMVLHWKSVIPAGIAHAVWNMLVFSEVSLTSQTRLADCGLWMAIAFGLYHLWPVPEASHEAETQELNFGRAI